MTTYNALKYAHGRAKAWPDAAEEGWKKDLLDFIRNRANDHQAAGRPLNVSDEEIKSHIPIFKENARQRDIAYQARQPKKGESTTFKTKPIYVDNPATAKFKEKTE